MKRRQTLNVIPTRKFRLLKGPDGEHGGGDSGQGGGAGGGNTTENNMGGGSGVNGGPEGNGQGTQNNGGNGFDAGSFWRQPSEGNEGSPPNGGSAAPTNPSGGQQPQNEGNAFVERLNGLNFNEVMNTDAANGINQGNAEAFNTNMTNFGRQAVRESVMMSAQLMQRFGQQMEERFQSMLEQKFGQRDSEVSLAESFPSYKQPGMKPIIDGIYAQAMRLSKGDNKAAIEMTKSMLTHSTSLLGKDFNLTTPPGGAGDSAVPKTNWEEELLGRSG